MTARLLDRFTGRFHLEGTLTTWTALHVGAGGSADALGSDAPVVRTGAGVPYIPGSSLKGVLRSAAEALFRNLPRTDDGRGLWACSTFGDDACGTHKRIKKLREDLARPDQTEVPARELAARIWEESCWICRLFGSMALASRVRFADLPIRGAVPLPEKRNGVGIERDKELAAANVLYDFEVVPPETPFELRVIVDNPVAEEIGLLLYLFQELDAGHLTLGGKASRGLGRVRVSWEKIEEITLEKGNPFAFLLSSRDLLAAPQAPPIAATVEAEPSDPFAGKLPATGDPAVWRLLAEILGKLPKVDKGMLGEKAAEHGLTKPILNQKLSLGLGDERRVRKVWDVILDRLAQSTLLAKEGGDFVFVRHPSGGQETRDLPDPSTPSKPFQDVIDTYVGAMARLWQEAS